MTEIRLTATQCLSALDRGDRSAADRLLPLVYDELRGLAAAYLQRERPDHTLQPTALVHEAYLRLIEQDQTTWESRLHFFAVATEAVRRVLVDHARQHKALKRGGNWQRVTLSEASALPEHHAIDLLALDDALEGLRQLNPRHYELVKLRFFGGLTGEETARILGVSRVTVTKDWAIAKAWLLSELAEKGT